MAANKKLLILRQTLSESYVFIEKNFPKTLASLENSRIFAPVITTEQQRLLIDKMRK